MSVAHLTPVPRDIRGWLVRELETGARVVLTPTEAALLLDLDARTVRRACQDGAIPSFKIGARTIIPGKAFLELLRAGAA